MRLRNKVFLSLCVMWAAFLCIVYIGTHAFLLNSLLQIGREVDSQEVVINHYAINRAIDHYLIVFIFSGLLFAALMWYLLRSVFVYHCQDINNQLRVIHETSDELKRIRLDEKDEFYLAARQFNQMMDDIESLKKDLANKMEKVNQLNRKKQALERRAVKADRADTVFHNVIDFLTSIAASVYAIREKIENSKAEKLTDLAKLLMQHQNNLDAFIAQDTKGQQVQGYLAMLAEIWIEENKYLLEEVILLGKNLMEIKNVIKTFDKDIEDEPINFSK